MFSIFRIIKIGFTLLPVIPGMIKDFESGTTTRKTAEKFRSNLQYLGPTFIKFGQMLSLRYDFIPQGYCEELQNLLDESDCIPFKKYIELLEKGLNIKLGDKFRNIDMDPIGCASLAQVHTGYLHNGKKVAVKVLRPNIKRVIKRDIRIIKVLGFFLDKIGIVHKFGIRRFIDEFDRWTMKELNLYAEGQNCDRFRDNFKNDKEVKIPRVYWEATSKKVLTIEYIEGVSVKDFISVFSYSKKESEIIQGIKISRKRIADIATKALFKQIIDYGFFHGDPHPANMVITPDLKLAFMDFGIVGSFSEARLKVLIELFISIAKGESDKALKYVIALDQVEGIDDIKELKRNVDEIFSKIKKLKITYYSPTIAFLELIKAGSLAGIDWPVDIFLLFKAMITLDGIAQKIYPQFKFFESFRPYFMKQKRKSFTENISTNKAVSKVNDLLQIIELLPETAGEVLEKIKQGKIEVLTKEDSRSLEMKDKTLKVITMLILNVLLFITEVYLIVSGFKYEIFRGVDIILVLFSLNLFSFVFLILYISRE